MMAPDHRLQAVLERVESMAEEIVACVVADAADGGARSRRSPERV